MDVSNPSARWLLENAQQIAETAADLVDWDGETGVLRAVVDGLATSVAEGSAVDVGPLRDDGVDAIHQARALRAVEAACIDCLNAKGGEGVRAAVLHVRHQIRQSISREPLSNQEFALYERLCDGGRTPTDIPPEQQQVEQFLLGVMSTLGEMVYVHDLNGNILYVNKQGMSLTGFSREDLQAGMSIYDFVAPKSVPLVEQHLETLGGHVWSPFIITIFTKDGHRIPLEVNARPIIEDGAVTVIVGVCREIHLERLLQKQAQQALALTEKIVEHVPIGLIQLDPAGNVIDVNPAALELIGAIDITKILGHPVTALAQEGDTTFARLGLPLADWKPFKVQYQGASAFGAQLHCEVEAVPWGLDKEHAAGTLVIMDNLLGHVALQKRLSHSEKLSAMGRIVAGVSHELNNPLTGIIGFTQLLLASDITDSVRTRVDQIAQESARCQKIVQNLLSFARKRDAQLDYENINSIVRETAALREYQLQVSGITLDLNLAEDLPVMQVDASALQSVFLNLVSNAQQILEEKIVPSRKGHIAITTQLIENSVHVTVTDNGPGIPQEEQALVFDPFYTTKEPGMGTGLGLSVAYGIVEDHGGQVLLESSDEGTSFTIVFPLEDDSPDPTE
jgi:two-component system NtrC family sensor kinase